MIRSGKLRARRGMIATTLAFLCVLTGCEDRETLPPVTTEKAAMVMQAALEARGVSDVRAARSTENREGAWVVSVPAEAGPAARAILVELDLPRDERPGLAELVRGFGLVPSPAQERAKLMAVMAGELCSTLEAIDGVVAARVHVSPPREADLDGSGAEPGSAMVLVKYTPVSPGERAAMLKGDGAVMPAGEPSDAPISAGAVREMVLRAVPGVEAARVDVVFTRARTPAAVARTQTPETTISSWRIWLLVLATAGAAMLVYGFIAARQFLRARLARSA